MHPQRNDIQVDFLFIRHFLNAKNECDMREILLQLSGPAKKLDSAPN